ncbi:uncharacterized protein LOC122847516 [Aphidius gifuensis]|uniref:uncharacterized protein LOC122847516 n=1 Tax=Aphidius gifuensis TaxID=684658 RepID=UPI001CDC82E7|nr:uncharacterized protein LOC122847516 [Aphidius gifuensis]
MKFLVKTPITGAYHWKKLWDDRILELENGFLKIYKYSVEKAKEVGSPTTAINLTNKSGFTLRTEIKANDVPKIVASKLKNIFIIEESSPSAQNISPQQIIIMAQSKIIKEEWIEKIKTLKKITSRQNKHQISIKTILRFEKNWLKYNCIVELNLQSKDILLFRSQEGLYCLGPFNRMSLLRGVTFIKNLSVHENMGLAIMIAGEDPELVSCDLRQLKSDAMAADCSRPAITTKNILNRTKSCHFYQFKNDLLCAATDSTIILLKWNSNSGGSIIDVVFWLPDGGTKDSIVVFKIVCCLGFR